MGPRAWGSVPVDDDPGAQGDRIVRDPVVLHHVGERILSVGDLLDLAAHQPLPVREQLVADLEHVRGTVLVE